VFAIEAQASVGMGRAEVFQVRAVSRFGGLIFTFADGPLV
jgi:hypothetical protein